MSSVIDDRARRSDPMIDTLFVQSKRDKNWTYENNQQQESRASAATPAVPVPATGASVSVSAKSVEGTILNLHNGYGFIRPRNEGDNLFFHYTDLQNADFNSLWMGDIVTFEVSTNQKGPCAKNIFRKNGRGNGNVAATTTAPASRVVADGLPVDDDDEDEYLDDNQE
jgi:cold shock CspA family protein